MSMKVAKRSMSDGPPVSVVTGVLFFVLSLLFAPTGASAAGISGTSRTYLQSHETVDGSKLLPLYEYLDFTVQDLGKESLTAHFGGWLGYDLQDSSFGNDRKNGHDLQYGYVSYRAKEHNAIVNLGRVMVFEGVAAERVNGVFAKTDLLGGFGISAFGGTPAEIRDIDLPGNSTIYGGRISHQDMGQYTVGLSYLKEKKNSNTFRQEAGIDIWYKPANKIELAGRSSYNLETTGWMEHSYYLMLGPFEKVRVNTEASWVSYGDYFTSATTSVFALTAGGLLDPKEKVSIVGPELLYTINNNWAVSADYKKYGYDIAGSAKYYGAKATYSLPKSYSAGASIHKMDGETGRLKYDQYRIYASKKINKTDIALDLLEVKYQEPINGVDKSYSATVAAGYEMTEKLKLGADLEYSKNPDFDKDVRIFLKLNYQFDTELGKRKGV